ncbi:hypothetical protein BGW36DRAFT_423939 [Talaromyces proteolyticus]|uniref:Zn(2)-C6 fungal-type domain-containing protein n=1 Tax=Talaromyces proteolyticus TaxID=1131652 RepID=A0AAD4KWD5_9EURO|nr:uncharacterized protein BGW36DRAFT_423939 [Talaromyces proteolyticus]KAH8701634.1 hypothetical protein BGW36DRAFT_423939 [Talaromyces proteolyticus]
MENANEASGYTMDPSNGDDRGRPLHRGQMRKACDSCRKSKIRCEKPENFPSCLACYHKGVACIITNSSYLQKPKTLRKSSSLIGPLDSFNETGNSLSDIVSFKQWSARFLHDFIYTYNPSVDIHKLPTPWKMLIQSQYGDSWKMIQDWMREAKHMEFVTPICSIGQQQIYISLPSEDEVLQVLDAFSHYTASVLPLFQEERIIWINTRKYADCRLIHDIPCWASLNIALAIGYKYSFIQHPEFPDRDLKSKAHLKNVLATVPQLLLVHPPTLATIQVLFGIVFLVQNGLEITTHQSLTSVAIRLSQNLGLHRPEVGRDSMPKGEYEQRVRIFWIGYVMDKSTCFTQGLMGCEDDDDIDIELLNDTSLDKIGLCEFPNGKSISLFRSFCELAVLRHKIYKALYSTRSAHIDNTHYKYIVKELSEQLNAWKESIPFNFEVHPGTARDQCGDSLILSRLLVVYHNSIILLYQWSLFYREAPHRREADHLSQTSRETWTSLCVSSARQTATILSDDNPRNTIGIRNMIHYALTSFMIIFMHVLEDPGKSTVPGDLQNLQIIQKYLSDIIEQNPSSVSSNFQAHILHLVQICSRCERLARRSTGQSDLPSQQI